jgi:NifU-like protein involved in Fe-S cluster formation
MMQEYSKMVLQHFSDPQYVGELALADNVYVAEAFAGGDKVKLFVSVEDNCIRDVRYQVYGCPAMIACMSWLACELRGKTVHEISALRMAEVLELPAHKRHCAVLAEEVLRKVIESVMI